MAATWKDTTKRITLYPAPGQKAVPTAFNRCQEHPTPFGGPCDPARPTQPVGYVVTVIIAMSVWKMNPTAVAAATIGARSLGMRSWTPRSCPEAVSPAGSWRTCTTSATS